MNVTDIVESWHWRMKKIRLDVKNLSTLVGVSPPTIYAYLNGDTLPPLKRYQVIETIIANLEYAQKEGGDSS